MSKANIIPESTITDVSNNAKLNNNHNNMDKRRTQSDKTDIKYNTEFNDYSLSVDIDS